MLQCYQTAVVCAARASSWFVKRKSDDLSVLEVSAGNVRRDFSEVCRSCCGLPVPVSGLTAAAVPCALEPYRESESRWSL
jgi:hypothetical protein